VVPEGSDARSWTAFAVLPSAQRSAGLVQACPQHDPRIRVAVAWICDDCNLVLGMVGLFTSWTAATYARQDEWDQRAAAYFDVASSGGADVPSSCSAVRGGSLPLAEPRWLQHRTVGS
jgi:hypothetical protein